MPFSATTLEKIKHNLPHFIWEIIRMIKSPKWQIAIWSDYLKTLRETRFLRSKSNQILDLKKTALVVSMTDSVFQLKIEALLAAGLQKEGWKVIILTTDPSNAWAKRFFQSFGLRDLVFWCDYQLSEREKDDCKFAANAFISKEPLSFPAVKAWTFDQSWIGPQILSSIARDTHKGAPNLSSPDVHERLVEILPETLIRVKQAKKLLLKIKPDFLYGIEANYALMGPIVDQALACGMQFVQVTQPSKDDSLIIRRLNPITRRVHSNSLTKESFQWLRNDIVWNEKYELALQQEFKDRYGGKWFLQSRNQVGTVENTREEISKKLNLDPNKKTAVVFSHILWDANLFFGEDLFADYEDWFIQTVKSACKNKNVNWIIKLHPANIWKRSRDKVAGRLTEEYLIEEHIGVLPNHVKLLFPDTNISTRNLFDLADYGITVRGTVGMELPCFGKPLFTAGTGRYSNFGFTNDSATKEEYLNKLNQIQEFPPMGAEEVINAKKYAFGVFKLRPFTLKSLKCHYQYQKSGYHPLDHNLNLTVSSWKEIEENGDLNAWAQWAGRPELADYLDKAPLQ